MTFLELEKKCKKRRVFKVLKILFLFIVIVSIYLFLDKNNLLLTKMQEFVKSNLKKIENKNIEEVKKEKKIISNNDKNSKNNKILELKFEVNFQELYQSYKNRINSKLKKENKIAKKTIKKDEIKEKRLEKKIIKSKNLPPYETCIKLAKEYYQKGDYKQALKWAKNANIQDNKKADSWIITSKILYKMGKKNEAIKLLEIYYNYTQNEKIKELIKKIK